MRLCIVAQAANRICAATEVTETWPRQPGKSGIIRKRVAGYASRAT
jgi:hypothetical protein